MGNELPKKALCLTCGKYRKYTIEEKLKPCNYKGKKIGYFEKIAYCEKCGERIDVPGLWDINLKAVQKIYANNISLEDVIHEQKLLKGANMKQIKLKQCENCIKKDVCKFQDGVIVPYEIDLPDFVEFEMKCKHFQSAFAINDSTGYDYITKEADKEVKLEK